MGGWGKEKEKLKKKEGFKGHERKEGKEGR